MNGSESGCDGNRLENHSDPGSMTLVQMDELKRYLDFLEQELLPKLMVTYGVGIYRPFRLWCLGAPQEAIPLDFVETLDRFRGRVPKFSYRVYVSDDCPERIDLPLFKRHRRTPSRRGRLRPRRPDCP